MCNLNRSIAAESDRKTFIVISFQNDIHRKCVRTSGFFLSEIIMKALYLDGIICVHEKEKAQKSV